MTDNFTLMFNEFITDEEGQGITEYGAVLAFVAILIAAFFLASGSLSTAISKAFVNIVTQLGKLAP